MTVQEAIDILNTCDPFAKIVNWIGEEFEDIEDNGDEVEFTT